MAPFVVEKQAELANLCQCYRVKRLDLFGSAATDHYDESRSDLDFLVEFAPCTPSQHYERYFGMIESLERLFGKRVDLVEASAARNPHFIADIERTRQGIYAA